jgi:peptide deformylase
MWEGCLSSGKASFSLFAKVPRFKKINAIWLDENGKHHEEQLEGLVAHVFQHETDHLDGILFVDKVTDSKSYMVESEYRKMRKKKRAINI